MREPKADCFFYSDYPYAIRFPWRHIKNNSNQPRIVLRQNQLTNC